MLFVLIVGISNYRHRHMFFNESPLINSRHSTFIGLFIANQGDPPCLLEVDRIRPRELIISFLFDRRPRRERRENAMSLLTSN